MLATIEMQLSGPELQKNFRMLIYNSTLGSSTHTILYGNLYVFAPVIFFSS